MKLANILIISTLLLIILSGYSFASCYCDNDVDTYQGKTALNMGLGSCYGTNQCEFCFFSCSYSTCKSCSESDGTDCNDNNAQIKPNAPEIMDGLDNNCNGKIDEGYYTINYYCDSDGDGQYGSALSGTCDYLNCVPAACTDNMNAAVDCNDNDKTIYMNAPELCDGKLNDCGGAYTDFGCDNDNDGYVNAAKLPTGTPKCKAGTIDCYGNDCDDNNPYIYFGNTNKYCDCEEIDGYPEFGSPEICDNIDNDCDVEIDEGFDEDGDGFKTCDNDCNDNDLRVNPAAEEICNNVDDDCNGLYDDINEKTNVTETGCLCTDHVLIMDRYSGNPPSDSKRDRIDQNCDDCIDGICQSFNAQGRCTNCKKGKPLIKFIASLPSTEATIFDLIWFDMTASVRVK